MKRPQNPQLDRLKGSDSGPREQQRSRRSCTNPGHGERISRRGSLKDKPWLVERGPTYRFYPQRPVGTIRRHCKCCSGFRGWVSLTRHLRNQWLWSRESAALARRTRNFSPGSKTGSGLQTLALPRSRLRKLTSVLNLTEGKSCARDTSRKLSTKQQRAKRSPSICDRNLMGPTVCLVSHIRCIKPCSMAAY